MKKIIFSLAALVLPALAGAESTPMVAVSDHESSKFDRP